LAAELLRRGLHDEGFVAERVTGFSAYAERVAEWTPERCTEVTGVAAEDVRRLAEMLGQHRPAAFLLGWGLQRYRNGGAIVRAIDALGAVAGSVGRLREEGFGVRAG
jgi:anaerobic selenocysteine-containing dehydrogenase